MTPLERILARCRRENRGHPTTCLIWQGARFTKGYGGIKIDGRVCYVHRVVIEADSGPIPRGMETDHLCRQHDCCERSHLEVVTPKVNYERGIARQRHREIGEARTHCGNGHERNSQNTRISPRGLRCCRVCDRERKHRLRGRLV